LDIEVLEKALSYQHFLGFGAFFGWADQARGKVGVVKGAASIGGHISLAAFHARAFRGQRNSKPANHAVLATRDQIAFPNSNDSPSSFAQLARYQPIARNILLKLR